MKKIFLTAISFFAALTILSAQEAAKEDIKKEVKDDVKKEVKKEVKKDKSTKDYIADLSSNDENLIIDAADYLGKEKEKDAIPQLKNLLGDKREKVRMYAAMALGYIGEEKTFNDLKERLMVEPNADIRYTIVLAISRIGVKEKKDLESLQKARQAESDPFIIDFLQKLEEKFTKK